MGLISITCRYMKRYPLMSIAALILIAVSSFFEGASLLMLVPLLQSMVSQKLPALSIKIPFFDGFLSYLSGIGQIKAVSLVFIILFLMILLKNAFLYFSRVVVVKLRLIFARDMRTELIDNILEYDVAYFDNTTSGYLISAVVNEVARMSEFILVMLNLVIFIGRVVSYFVLLLILSWKASMIALCSIAVVLLMIDVILGNVRRLGTRLTQAMSDYTNKLYEALGGIRLIKGCGTEEKEKDALKVVTDMIYNVEYKGDAYNVLILPLSETMMVGLITASFLVLINVTKLDITGSFPVLMTYLLVLARALTQLYDLNSKRAAAVAKLAAFKRYEEISEKLDKRTILSGMVKPEKFTDAIEYKGVNFSYAHGKKVLHDVDFMIPKGKITAIVGPSGSGKSTIINLILRFYDPDSGTITVDGAGLKNIALKEWRRKIGLVSQDIFVFNTSVRENIAYGRDVSLEDVRRAAVAANAHDFISGMQNGYDTIVGERGVKLSGGQKQRISIARAIIHNPDILILDEATSSLDTETERLISEAIDRLTKNRTVVAIAHRLSTVMHADTILVLENGRVAERGSHQQLIERNGVYKKLYESQFSAAAY